jgi:uncharacterized membrane protein YoaT (DUF817 family)
MSRLANLNTWAQGRVVALDAWARPWSQRSRLRAYAYEFLLFGLKQAWACIFGAAMLALIVATHLWWPDHAPLARYDFLVIGAVALQLGLIAFRLERLDEALVIAIFHVVGTAMEVFKTAHGSWIYPEPSLLRIGGVPLFSGFMYACIGSYIARITRLFDIRFVRYPPVWTTWVLAIGAYVNFFSHHYLPDIRLGLFAFSVLIFGRSWFQFTPDDRPRRMPVIVGLLLVSLFIWFAENLGTLTSAWVYPNQREGWRLVSIDKLGAWYLLMLLSWVLVSLVHRPEGPEAPPKNKPVSAGGGVVES